MKMTATLTAALLATTVWATMAAAQTDLSMWYHGAGNPKEAAVLQTIIDDFNASQSDWLPTTIPSWPPPSPAICPTSSTSMAR